VVLLILTQHQQQHQQQQQHLALALSPLTDPAHHTTLAHERFSQSLNPKRTATTTYARPLQSHRLHPLHHPSFRPGTPTRPNMHSLAYGKGTKAIGTTVI